MLLPPRFHIADEMPMSLGKAIAKAIAPKVDHITAFETSDHTKTFFSENVRVDWAAVPPFVKRVKKQEAREIIEQAAKQLAAPPSQKFKVGDRVRTTVDLLHIDIPKGSVGIFVAQQGLSRARVAFDPDSSFRCLQEWNVPEECLELIPCHDAEADEWIEWKGGARPVSPMTEIEVRYGDGQPRGCRTHGTAGSWTEGWIWTDPDNRKNSIVAYRVVKP